MTEDETEEKVNLYVQSLLSTTLDGRINILSAGGETVLLETCYSSRGTGAQACALECVLTHILKEALSWK